MKKINRMNRRKCPDVLRKEKERRSRRAAGKAVFLLAFLLLSGCDIGSLSLEKEQGIPAWKYVKLGLERQRPADVMTAKERALQEKFSKRLTGFNYSLDLEGRFARPRHAPDEYYIFRYSEEQTWEIEHILGPNCCKEGYLYAKHYKSGAIYRIMDVPIDQFCEIQDRIYCVVNGAWLYEIEQTDFVPELVYIAPSGEIRSMSSGCGNLYIADGGGIAYFDEESREVVRLFDHPDVWMARPINEMLIYWMDGDDNQYLYDVALRTWRATDDDEYYELLEEENKKI